MLSSFTQYYWIELSLIVQDSPLLAKSLGLISVPVWLIIFSDQLRIIGLVRLYRYQLPNPIKAYLKSTLSFLIFRIFTASILFFTKNIIILKFEVKFFYITHLYAMLFLISIQLACVKYTASVHPEPGSNSHLI